jgi:hypothetical protein
MLFCTSFFSSFLDHPNAPLLTADVSREFRRAEPKVTGGGVMRMSCERCECIRQAQGSAP